MCVVSMIIDHYDDKWSKPPYIVPNVVPGSPTYIPVYPQVPPKLPTQEEIDEFHRLLKRAREYDKKNNEPDCELQEKKNKIKKLADELGIDISFIDKED